MADVDRRLAMLEGVDHRLARPTESGKVGALLIRRTLNSRRWMERWGCAAVVMVALAFSTLKAAPQWSYSASQRVAAAPGREVILAVACTSAGPVISIRFRDDSRFGTGVVVASFDTGTTLDVEFANRVRN